MKLSVNLVTVFYEDHSSLSTKIEVEGEGCEHGELVQLEDGQTQDNYGFPSSHPETLRSKFMSPLQEDRTVFLLNSQELEQMTLHGFFSDEELSNSQLSVRP